METIDILNELNKLQEQIAELNDRIGELSYDVKLSLAYVKANRTNNKSELSKALDRAPSDVELDKIEAEELAKAKEELNKFNCTYPDPENLTAKDFLNKLASLPTDAELDELEKSKKSNGLAAMMLKGSLTDEQLDKLEKEEIAKAKSTLV